KLEVEIERDNRQLRDDGQVPELVKTGKTSRQLDKPDGREEQFMKSQPKIFDVALLCEIKCQQEERQRHEQNGSDQPRKALEETMNGPEFEGAAEVFAVAQAQRAVGEEGRIGFVAHRNIDAAHNENERGIGGRQVEIIDAGDLLIARRLASVRAIRPNVAAVGKDIEVKCLRADGRV